MKRRTLLWIGAGLVLAGAAAYPVVKKISAGGTQFKSAGRRGMMGGAMMGPRAVRVSAATREDFPTYLRAIGTVSAAETVSVQSQIQGKVLAVHFKEGSYVEKGTLLATIDTASYEANLAQYRGELAQANAQLKNAQSSLTRYEKLIKQKAISQQDYDSQIQSVQQYRGNVVSAQAKIRQAEVNIAYGAIRAPISGYVGIRQVDVGNLVSAGSGTICTITRTDVVSVRFSLAQAEARPIIAALRAGESRSVTVFEQKTAEKLATGSVSVVDNQIDALTGTIGFKATVGNTENKLFPNQAVTVELLAQTYKDAIVIESVGVVKNSSGTYVFVVDDENIAHLKRVRLAFEHLGERVVVARGLKPGDRIVTTGVDMVRDGTPVSIVEKQVVDTTPKPRGQRGKGQGRGGRGMNEAAKNGKPASAPDDKNAPKPQ